MDVTRLSDFEKANRTRFAGEYKGNRVVSRPVRAERKRATREPHQIRCLMGSATNVPRSTTCQTRVTRTAASVTL